MHPHPRVSQINMSWVGLGLAVGFWFLETAVHTWIFQHGPFMGEFIPYEPNELWMRSLVCTLLALFGLYGERMLKYQREASRRLAQAERDWEITFNAVQDPIILHDHDNRILRANEAYLALAGLPIEKIVGRPYWEVFPRQEGPFFTGTSLGLGEKAATEVEFTTEEGETFLSRMFQVEQKEQERFFWVQFIKNVTRIKEAEDQLRMAAKVMEVSPSGIMLTDPETNILWVNSAFEAITGYRTEDIIGKKVSILKSGLQDQAFYKRMWTRIIENGEWQGEIWDRRQNGEIYPEWLAIAAVGDDQGQVGQYVGLFTDISERKQAEIALQSKTKELERSNAELEQFAYVVTHDLQEPVRMVRSFVQLLAKRYAGKLDQDAEEFIGYALEGSARLKALIDDLLEYSRVKQTGKPLGPIDSAVALSGACDNLKLAIEENGATVTADPLPVVMADQTQLTQLFQNLIGNAVKFRRVEPPKVHVGARRQDGAWQFSVQDNGIGIQSEYVERIFDIFQRLHTQQEYPGTGIGLAVSKKIVEHHGGRIWVESNPDHGATFFFTLSATPSGV